MLHFQTVLLLVLASLLLLPTYGIRPSPEMNAGDKQRVVEYGSLTYLEAPEYRNGRECPILDPRNIDSLWVCNPSFIHIAMTLDSKYLRGSIAAVHSILKHTSCPENVYLHFIASDSNSPLPDELTDVIESTFPSLAFKIYPFSDSLVKNLISPSIRQALEHPLNYARTYLADLLEPCVGRVIYLDSDVVLVDDVQKLWSVSLTESRVIGAPVYCRANFTRYFTNNFWFDRELSAVFKGKQPCYFNTGVMVMNLARWRAGNYRNRIEKWMEIQKERRIYELGSLPPFLLVFGGDVEPIDHRWNQHGLGGNNTVHSCRPMHNGPVSLLHWSGKGKPWERIDAGNRCEVDNLWAPYEVDNLWAPYDLFRHNDLPQHQLDR